MKTLMDKILHSYLKKRKNKHESRNQRTMRSRCRLDTESLQNQCRQVVSKQCFFSTYEILIELCFVLSVCKSLVKSGILQITCHSPNRPRFH